MKKPIAVAIAAMFAAFVINCGGTAERNESKNAAARVVNISPAAPVNPAGIKRPSDSDDAGNANRPRKTVADDIPRSCPATNANVRDGDDRNRDSPATATGTGAEKISTTTMTTDKGSLRMPRSQICGRGFPPSMI
jgi:hypothetical protein